MSTYQTLNLTSENKIIYFTNYESNNYLALILKFEVYIL